AMFFSTHRFSQDAESNRCNYEFIGTNSRQSVLYVFRENSTEMGEHEHHRAVETFGPQRPLRQSCVVALGGMDALNLPLEFLEGVIVLDFDDLSGGNHTVESLFPSVNEDRFLAALIGNLFFPQHITTF